MDPAPRDPVEALLDHYHARLLACPALVSRLRACGLATAETLPALRLGLADRTAFRALLRGPSRGPLRERPRWQDAWGAAGFLLPNGRERFRGCIVLPLQGTVRAVGLRVSALGAAGSPLIWSHASGRRHFASCDASPSLTTGTLTVTSDPFDALLLRFLGAGPVMSVEAGRDAADGAEMCRLVGAMRAGRLLVIVPGTSAGRALIETVAGLTPEATSARHPRLEIVPLPAGCHLRDVWRLHGASAAAAVLAGAAWRPPVVRAASPAHAPAKPPAPPSWHGAAGTLAGALRAYLAHLLACGASRGVVAQRGRALEIFRQACVECGSADLHTLSVAVVEAFQRAQLACVDAHGVPSRNGIIRTLCAVRLFLRWALQTGRLTRDLTAGLPALRRAAVAPPPVLTATEVERVVSAVPVRTAGGLRDRAMLEVLYSSGIRRVELVGLDVTDLDAARGTLTVRRGKGGTARLVPLGRRAWRWVARYVEQVRVAHLTSAHEPALFISRRGRRMSAKSVTGRMRACLRAAGIDKAGSCHIFRHTAATLMHDRGADIRDLQALLGHALLTSTQLYTRVSMQRLLAVHARTHPAEGPEAASAGAEESAGAGG